MQDNVKKKFNFKRPLVAAVVLPLLGMFLHYAPHYPHFFILLLIVTLLALREFFVMYKVSPRLRRSALAAGGVLFFVMCFEPYPMIEAIFICFLVILLIRLFSGTPEGAMRDMGPIGAGYLYILGFMTFQWLLRNDASGRFYIIFLYSSVWLADSAAYYVGTYLGKNKLAPSISPKKTWEGVAGSVFGGAAGGFIITYLYGFEDLSVLIAVIYGSVLGTVAVGGDLIESMFKRDAGVKDSGSMFPGHGGLLDKLDGVLVAGPVFYFLLGLL